MSMLTSTRLGAYGIISPLAAGGMGKVHVSQRFIKLGTNLEPLLRYAKELIAPIEQPGSDSLAEWYRHARKSIPQVRVVYLRAEAGATRALLSGHLEVNVVGDECTEHSFVYKPVRHVELTVDSLITRHLGAVLGAGAGK